MYCFDFFVTGSNVGTLNCPNYSLERVLKVVIFTQVKQLVQYEGKFDNTQVVIQGYSDGTHKDDLILTFANDYFQQEGWEWYP